MSVDALMICITLVVANEINRRSILSAQSRQHRETMDHHERIGNLIDRERNAIALWEKAKEEIQRMNPPR